MDKITAKQIADKLKEKVVGKDGTPDERKKKAEWFDKHVIVDMGSFHPRKGEES